MTEEIIRDALLDFTVRDYEVSLKAQGTPDLPDYLGSTLRGALAMAMRRTLCSDLGALCGECKYCSDCGYAQIFEPELDGSLPHLEGARDVPRPFVIRPPLPGQPTSPELIFHILLFGDSFNYLPHLIFALQAMAEVGLGARRDKFSLTRVTCGEKMIFTSQEGKLQGLGEPVRPEILFGSQSQISGVTCQFITPLRVKYKSRLGPDLTFEVFVRTLMRRISSLSRLYCGFDPQLPYKELVSSSKNIEVTRSHLNWKDWQRYSNRQKTSMQMGGMLGSISYSGELEVFRPLVNLGRYTHVGKGTIFGLGSYNAWWE